MSDTATAQETYASKIEKLLRRAEHPNTPQPEADACIAKAQELMVTYAIDEEMIARAGGRQVEDKITRSYIDYFSNLRLALFQIGKQVAVNNGVKHLISKNDGAKPQFCRLMLVGFESDIERVKLLDTSLQVQCSAALNEWWKTYELKDMLSGGEKFRTRRDFVYGFAIGVGRRLAEANQLARDEAAKHEAARSDTTNEVATKGVALVLADRNQRLEDWYDKHVGRSKRKVSHSYGNGIGGLEPGRAAGSRADVGGTRLSGRKAIGS